MGLREGTKLGPYEIVCLLGAGGMGEVYRARDPRLERDVAIKLVSARLTDASLQQRLQMEARAISQLQHPNICALYDIGTYQDETFLVMELLEGETLQHKLLRGALPVTDLVATATDLAAALEYAHAKGIIHRDIKPGNIFVTAHGGAKLMDFGLVKRTQASAVPDAEAVTAGTTAFDLRLTSPGAALGTVAYMSPEQARGEDVDQRSDLFSFGAVLYEACTGRLPFPGATSAVIFDAILNRAPVAPVTLKPGLPPALSDLINKLLDKDKDLRYQSASELRTDLKRLRRELDGGSSGRASSAAGNAPDRSWQKWIVAALAIVVLAGLGFWLFRRRAPAARNDAGPVLDIRALTSTGHATVAAGSPDGRYVAYVNRDNGKSELRLLQTATGRDVVILPATPEVIGAPHFSPDGDFIYFLRELDTKTTLSAGVFRMATLGGPAVPIATDAAWFGLAVSPDGKQLAYASYANKSKDKQQIVVIQADGSNRRVLTTSDEVVWFLEWSPQGDKIAAVTFTDTDMIMVTVSVADGSVRDFGSHNWEAVGQPAWAPDGATIFAPGVPRHGATKQIWAIDPRNGARHPVTSGTNEYNQFTLSITGAGELVAGTSNFDSAVWITDATGARPQRIGTGTGEGSDSVAWVGNKVVSSNTRALTVRDADGGNPTQLSGYSTVHHQLARCGPSQVVFLTNDEKRNAHIGRVDLNAGLASPLTDGDGDAKPSCTSDGSIVVFQQCDSKADKCYIVRKSVASAEVTRLVPLNPADGAYPMVSPDDSTILFQREPDAKDPYQWLGVMPLRGGEPKFIHMPIASGDADLVRWSADGQAILFSWLQNGVGNVWSVPLAGGHPKQLTHFDADRIFGFDVAADGRLVISRGKRVQDIVLIKNAK